MGKARGVLAAPMALPGVTMEDRNSQSGFLPLLAVL